MLTTVLLSGARGQEGFHLVARASLWGMPAILAAIAHLFGAGIFDCGQASAAENCQTQFRRLVHGNRPSGPYEIEEENAQTYKRDGKMIQINSLTQIVVPSAARLRTAFLPLNITNDVIEIGPQAWVYADGRWAHVSFNLLATSMPAILKNGFISGHISRVKCLGQRQNGGRNVVAFRYTANMSGLQMPIQIVFDPSTGLPVSSEGVAEDGQVAIRYSAQFRFGADIQIKPPVF